jgi:hypothetical protein
MGCGEMVAGRFGEAFPQGLNSLRKKSQVRDETDENIPQGLKPSMI